MASLRTASGLSQPSAPVTLTVGGTWGIPSAPTIVTVAAADTGAQAGLGSGDSLLVTFDQNVSPTAFTAGSWTLQPLLPAEAQCVMSGAWKSPSSLRLTLVLDPAWAPGDASPWAVTRLRVSVLPSAGIYSANGESGPSSSSAVVSQGSWGDAPVVTPVASALSSVTVTLQPPALALPYPVVTYVVQWSTFANFTDVAPLPSTVLAVEAWVQDPAQLSTLAGATTVLTSAVSGESVGPVVLVNTTGMAEVQAHGTAIARVLVAGASPPYTVELTGLPVSVSLFLRAACNNDGTVLGPGAPSQPPSVTLLLPSIQAVTTPAGVLNTVGGTAVFVSGDRLGTPGAIVIMVLSNGEFSFRSPPCTVVSPGTSLQCVVPPGVGARHNVTLVVDGVASAPFAGGLLAYRAPVVLEVVVQRDPVEAVSTSGGPLVILTGRFFGSVALGPQALQNLSLKGSALSLDGLGGRDGDGHGDDDDDGR